MDRYFWIVFKRIKVIKADLDNNAFFIKEFLFTDFLIATRKRISRVRPYREGRVTEVTVGWQAPETTL